jgi:hypothetical protein
MESDNRFTKAISTFDEYNSKDPNQVEWNGQRISKELLYAQRMSEKLEQFNPAASEHLQLAARCQHIGRWEIPRSSYPATQKGYLQWRNELKFHHASLAESVLRECEYDAAFIEKVKFLVLKKQLQQHPESQLLEDIICLVFIEYYLEEFAAKHEDEKVVSILRKTMRKMSPRCIEAVGQLILSDKLSLLIAKASEPVESVLFKFEEEFMEDNIRCIPMAVRMKLDVCGIKLKLAEWNKFTVNERSELMAKPCTEATEISAYRKLIQGLVYSNTGSEATDLSVDEHPAWKVLDQIQPALVEKLNEFGWTLPIEKWKALSDLQRFALLKLSRPSHENKNFTKAMKEFGLAI